ncbi:uncharacterized protein LOC113755187 [Coffea eugenioides]|uniref:uncharacterized protein LOC113755187 n=1 Tax=Coffea eugenioides TaxID=49369 RepID=UPI000F61327E|nr:uncharacterized protein LOC113755187 [Coffea eugenioides]
MNGAVEAANKNLKKIIRKMTEKHRDWHENLPYALMAYRISIRTSSGAMPYSLMYEMEAVLSVEVEIPSLRILMETKLDKTDWIKQRHKQLSLIDEKRLNAICHGQCYQKRMARAYNKKERKVLARENARLEVEAIQDRATNEKQAARIKELEYDVLEVEGRVDDLCAQLREAREREIKRARKSGVALSRSLIFVTTALRSIAMRLRVRGPRLGRSLLRRLGP